MFSGKVAVVTGAAGALGQAVAQHFMTRGAQVVCLDYSDELLQRSFPERQGNHVYAACDLTSRQDCLRVMTSVREAVPRVDILANIAGGFMMGKRVDETTDETWDFLFNLNTRSIMHMAAAVVPMMLASGGGKIINVAARAATAGVATMGPYTASKAAVMRLTESMALELRNESINVNCILPGTIDTPRNREDMPGADHSTWVPPADLAAVVGFLASDSARAVHGAGIPVDGLS